MRCGALILAAGAAERFGSPKATALWHGRPLLRHVIDAARDGGCEQCAVVLGANAEQLRTICANVCVVENPDWRRGIGSSIRTGVSSLREFDAVLLLLADQPLISAVHVQRLIAVHESSGKGIVASEFAGTCGPPALFAASYFNELAALFPAHGAKTLFTQFANDFIAVPCPEAACDIDTPGDLARIS